MKKRKVVAFLLALAVTTSFVPMINAHAEDTAKINVSIDTSAENAKISPYIYGANYDFSSPTKPITAGATATRLGGNRTTGYNWENNASNAGSDWLHSSDNYLVMNADASLQNVPGKAYTDFQDKVTSLGSTYSLVTLPMAGYVAKDKNGAVSEAEAAPSARWNKVQATKGSALSLTPDLTDNYVYMDEFMNLLISKYGKANTSTGIKGYSLDNEPGLWSSTHPRIHKDKVTCSELISRSTEYSKMVKNMDSNAEVFGPALFGMGAYLSLVDAPDWSSVKGNYNWYIDYYLNQMKAASDTAGKRLLDVFDVHYYSEATGGGVRVTEPNTTADCNKARIQAPRTLWDSTYTETSWIGQWCKSHLPVIPKIQSSIDTYYPGTKLGITEYNFGGNNHISGGIAEADTLGIFGKNNVYYASVWPFSGTSEYLQSAFNLYRNYDGKKSTYGDTKVKAETSDIENSSVYASVDSKDPSKLHVIMINKNYDKPMTMNFNIGGNKIYGSGKVWAFDESSAQITEKTPITNITDNKFEYTVPKLTVCHIVLDIKQNADTEFITGDVNGDNTVDIRDYTALQKYITGESININKENADINKDTRINTADLFALKKIILEV